MKRKIKYLVILILSFIPFINVKADQTSAVINSSSVGFYKNANDYNMVNGYFIFDIGDKVYLNGEKIASTIDICSSDFYYGSYTYKGTIYNGYVCADYLSFDLDLTLYEEEFKKNNIPEIYWESLTVLKKAYPNWQFKGIETNLNWEDVISAESVVGKNLIQLNNPLTDEDKAFLSLDGGSFDPSTNTYMHHPTEGNTWYYPNKKTIAYYMDPRNFFNERNIFMFESLGYNNYATDEELKIMEEEEIKPYSFASIEAMLQNTGLAEYAEKFEMAGQVHQINSVALAARSKQEVVLGDGSLSGSIDKENNLYNFFNINAYAYAYADCDNNIACALMFASKNDWTTPEKAILGGAEIIASNYIKKGQDTIYFQKWDVIDGGNGIYTHQYMSNISAPLSESSKTYDSYVAKDIINRKFTFNIPVYLNMPKETSSKPTEVDKEEIDKIIENNEEIKNTLTPGELIVGAGFKNNAGFVSGITLGMTVKELKEKIKNISNEATIKVTYNGVEVADTNKVATGYEINLTNSDANGIFNVVLYGDVSGDGEITVLDLLKVQKSILGSANLNESEKKSSDANKDDKTNALDLLIIQRHILGSMAIEQ